MSRQPRETHSETRENGKAKLRLPVVSDFDESATRSSPSSGPAVRGVRLLVSACLLGDKVRYDGQHKYDRFLVEKLGPFVEWERVCPESDCGMPTPRPSMHLIGDPVAPRLLSRIGEDLTDTMRRFTEHKLRQLESVELCGYVCKKGSPSSGLQRVKVYDLEGQPVATGVGLFTRAFMERFPLVPVEDEGRLHDPGLREAFIERVFCRRRWLDLVAEGRHRSRLVDFHTDHKYLLLAHGAAGYSELGRLVASAKHYEAEDLFARYEQGFAAALAHRTTRKTVSNVLLHMLGYFKKQLSRDDKAELLEAIDAYRSSLVPVIVPLTLIKHYVRKYQVDYLSRQAYLAPYPEGLMLRNHV